MRRRFSASGFIDDVRTFGATRFNYVGKVLEYILATPPRDVDADNRLRIVTGSEASERDIAAFGQRFDVYVMDGFGSTEGGVGILRTPDMPARRARPAAGREHRRDGSRRPRRSARAPGSTPTVGCSTPTRRSASSSTRPAWPPSRATTATTRPTPSGRATAGTGRATSATATSRATSTSPAAATTGCASTARTSRPRPIERIILRHPDVLLAAVYAVPDPNTGDQLMVAVQLARGQRRSTRTAFRAFLAAQGDLGTKWVPRFVRVAAGAAGQPHQQDQEGAAAPGGVARRRPGVVPSRSGRRLPTVRARPMPPPSSRRSPPPAGPAWRRHGRSGRRLHRDVGAVDELGGEVGDVVGGRRVDVVAPAPADELAARRRLEEVLDDERAGGDEGGAGGGRVGRAARRR